MDALKQNTIFGNRRSVLVLLLISLLVFAESSPSGIQSALVNVCELATNFLGVIMLLMVLTAAVAYAAGQIMGAETRARATVWATAMLTGAILAALLYLVAPYFIDSMGIGNVSCSGDSGTDSSAGGNTGTNAGSNRRRRCRFFCF